MAAANIPDSAGWLILMIICNWLRRRRVCQILFSVLESAAGSWLPIFDEAALSFDLAS